MNKRLKRLISRATVSAHRRHHRLSWTIGPNMATARCNCGCYVQVLQFPQPNQIDIGGDAVAIECPYIRIPFKHLQ